MNHSHAVASQAVERYLLRELSTEEAEEFEQHYFDCAECAMAVESGTQFIETARAEFGAAMPAVARRPVAPVRKPFWTRLSEFWAQPAFAAPAFAALLFGGIALYQGVAVIPGMRQAFSSARAIPAFQLAGASRGAVASVAVPANAASFALSVDIPPDVHLSRYVVALTGGNRTVFQLRAPAPAENQPLVVQVPVSGLRAGSYELVIYGAKADGAPGDRIVGYPFQLQIH
jgi:hypothetical protein